MPLPPPLLSRQILTVAVILLCSGCEPQAAPPAAQLPHPSRGVAAPRVVARPASNPLDAQRAFGYLSQVANLGPRPSGSPGMARQQALLTPYFEHLGGKVTLQPFTIPHPQTGQPTTCANLVVEWHPERTERVLLCAHYDTRPLPDRDPNPRRRREGVFIGANDGASGVAVLMELAHHLPQQKLAVGVDFVLFDAEELVYVEQRDEYFLGSTYFARQYRQQPPKYRYRWGVLLDMVGDRQLELLQEGFSMSWADTRPLVLEIWSTAQRLGVKEFVPRTKRGLMREGWIRDDHLPLRNIAGIPTCDIIDADYPNVPFGHPNSYWHTEQDVPGNCSGESLAKVGWVVLEWLKTVP